MGNGRAWVRGAHGLHQVGRGPPGGPAAREVGAATDGNVQLMQQLSTASSALRQQGDTLEDAMTRFKLA